MLNLQENVSEEDSLCEALIQGEKPPIGFYRKSKNRILMVRYLVEACLGREGKNCLQPLKVEDFKQFNLYGLLTTYYNCSPRKALQEAYKEELKTDDVFNDKNLILQRLISKEIKEPPRGFWTNLENRIFTTKYLINHILKKTDSQIYDISAQDFTKNCLGGFLAHYYLCSPNKAILEAYPQAYEFLFKRVDVQIWQDEVIRKKAINYFINKVDKGQKITFKLLISLGMKHSLAKFYNGDIKKLLADI